MVLVIELENALAHMHTTVEPSKMWSPYREPLAKFLNKYTVEVAPRSPCCCLVSILCALKIGILANGFVNLHSCPPSLSILIGLRSDLVHCCCLSVLSSIG